MNSLIETLNQRGGNFLGFAWPMLWQSSLLIMALFAMDFLFRRKLRASIRYALWLVVLVKLCVPPTVALPTSPAWWLHTTPPPAVAKALPHYTVTYDNGPLPELPQLPPPAFVPPKPTLTNAAGLLMASAAVSLALLGWLLVRWWQVTRLVRRAATAEQFSELLDEALRLAGAPVSGPACSSSFLKRAGPETGAPGAWQTSVRLKLVEGRMSPAVCGLLRPVILLPRSLAERLSAGQLRAVLLHELIHLRRRDVWLNFAQALLQIVYWWHPLVWLANARIRRVREEAVDDAVMLALRDEAESYAPTLLAVAKLALARPLASLGLVGIMESRHSLRQRIERLVDFRPPRQAGLTLVSLLGILAFTAVAVPMGSAPEKPDSLPASDRLQTLTVKVNPELFIRNVKAQAANYLHTTNDYYLVTLVDILRSEGVDCNPPHELGLNIKTGEMTAKNSPDALEIFRQIIEQLNRPDGKGGLFLPDSSYHRSFHPTSVLITAQFYAMRTTDFKKIIGYVDNASYDPGNYLVAAIAAERFAGFNEKIKSLGLSPFSKPRVQTGHGMLAELYTGVGTNGVYLDCLPYINAKGIELAFRAKVIGNLSADGTTLVGTANHAFSGRVTAQDHDGIIVCANNSDGSVKNNLVVVLEVQIVTNAPPVKTRSGGHGVNRITADTISAPLSHLAATSSVQATMIFNLNNPIRLDELKRNLETAGVKNPATAFYYKEDDGRLLARGSAEQLVLVNRAVLKLRGLAPVQIEADSKRFQERMMKIPPADASGGLYSRTFKVGNETFLTNLKPFAGGSDLTTNSPAAIGLAVRNYFTSLDLDLKSPFGQSIYYNGSRGELFVRTSLPNMDTVEQAIALLSPPPPQIHIKARFIEAPKGTLAGLENVIAVTNQPARSNQVAGLVGILTDKNFRTVLRNLEALPGAETLAEPECVTTSGRQTQMRATVVSTIITNFVFVENPTNGVASIVPQSGPIETGPVLDVVPNVLSDGYTINLALIPSLTEFLGYATPTNTTTAYNRAGDKIDVPGLLPIFCVRQTVANVNLWDDQTVVIGGMPATSVSTTKDKVPVLAGLPLLGRLFQSQSQTRVENELLVFITATIVDPAGNRVHSDDELPFAKTGVPAQPAQRPSPPK